MCTSILGIGTSRGRTSSTSDWVPPLLCVVLFQFHDTFRGLLNKNILWGLGVSGGGVETVTGYMLRLFIFFYQACTAKVLVIRE